MIFFFSMPPFLMLTIKIWADEWTYDIWYNLLLIWQTIQLKIVPQLIQWLVLDVLFVFNKHLFIWHDFLKSSTKWTSQKIIDWCTKSFDGTDAFFCFPFSRWLSFYSVCFSIIFFQLHVFAAMASQSSHVSHVCKLLEYGFSFTRIVSIKWWRGYWVRWRIHLYEAHNFPRTSNSYKHLLRVSTFQLSTFIYRVMVCKC